ncbi:hypothetical protein [Larkinella humicola]|uniref:Uncharacterized protein n=1 Tax=Larkinella humicola TaxID=2607654 RepID=A0A5N1JB89_9BACT|nr:hypothetical protein [Larkinella humicola]KAA9349741.1 hypothetical protein F0P93_20020 [Larkinella humicola]
MAAGNKQTIREFIDEMNASTQEILQHLNDNGINYNLNAWVTIAKYANLFNIGNTSTISSWISQGIIPPENVIEITALNGLKLIKAVAYS